MFATNRYIRVKSLKCDVKVELRHLFPNSHSSPSQRESNNLWCCGTFIGTVRISFLILFFAARHNILDIIYSVSVNKHTHTRTSISFTLFPFFVLQICNTYYINTKFNQFGLVQKKKYLLKIVKLTTFNSKVKCVGKSFLVILIVFT